MTTNLRLAANSSSSLIRSVSLPKTRSGWWRGLGGRELRLIRRPYHVGILIESGLLLTQDENMPLHTHLISGDTRRLPIEGLVVMMCPGR